MESEALGSLLGINLLVVSLLVVSLSNYRTILPIRARGGESVERHLPHAFRACSIKQTR